MRPEPLVHVFLVSFPGHGHVNPLLRLGKRLASKGLLVTLSTPKFFGEQMAKANNLDTDRPVPVGDGFVRFEFFHDGWDEDDPRRVIFDQYMHQLELVGKQEVTVMIKKYAEQNHPVACLINNPFITWASDLAESLGIPSAMLWVQSCACFATYYHYRHGSVPFPSETDPEIDVQLPSMPVLKHDEVPSCLHPSTPHSFLRTLVISPFKKLEKPFCVLMDTFEELEPEIVEYMSKFCPIKTVGPLFKHPQVPESTVRCDETRADDCIEWLDSKPASSVIYISFGTVVYMKQEQVDEIAHALLDTGISFLWVMKPPPKCSGHRLHTLPLGFVEKVGDNGKIVQWSPQERVLTHPSVSCFVSHCGWNSTIEALSSGVPIIAFPQWGDQVTNAVYLVHVFKTGVRICCGEAENRIIPKEEVEKCFRKATMGPKASELKSNALKWKAAADEAVVDGSSSDANIQAFIDAVKRRGTSTTTNHPDIDAGGVNYSNVLHWENGLAKCRFFSRSVISAASAPSLRSPQPLPRLRPPTSSAPRLQSRRLSYAPSRILGGLGCFQPFLPLNSMVPTALLTSHLTVNLRACCELTHEKKIYIYLEVSNMRR